MALSNYDRVGKSMEALRTGLGPFVEREVVARSSKDEAQETIDDFAASDRMLAGKSISTWDVAALLNFMWVKWNEVFSTTLGRAQRSLVAELRDHRNSWAHQTAFSSDDAYRVLDSVSRLLAAVSAPEAEEVERMKQEQLRVRFDEQVRTEKRKATSAAIESAASGTLTPWREVVTPHRDVASGTFQQAEFAADLWQVHLGEGSDEYRDPVEFFRRTYLTESLKGLLTGAIRRLSGSGGDPVVQLQTNFGGGKTHSMLALYHLFSGTKATELVGIEPVLKEIGSEKLPKVRRVVLVGNRISPGNPVKKEDGTLVRTLWGELAWQLGGKKAYDRVALDDERATSPGDALRELFIEYGPCLILIDEWVAYARQLHDQGDLPGGGFETHFSFAQVLTESAKLAKNCLVVISLPASDDSGSPHTLADDAEVGGERGREALVRLRNVVGRVESSWRPATAEEGFEIVRRRLFEQLTDSKHFRQRDTVARAFADFYRAQQQEFPPEARDSDYEKRIKAAYPIHPEVFDRLYTDWSTLLKFQRTRGVLRLMATVIHSLWESGDKNPLIMPANIAIDDDRVQFEMTRYLSDNWAPIIEKDVDGPASLPLRIDAEVPNLGKYAATRRVARTIYLGSAPKVDAAHHGIEDRRIKLGCVMPGETPSIFVDALRRLAAAATYLYQDGPHYWYNTQPTVTKIAEDRATQYARDPDKVSRELERRLREDLAQKSDFDRIHPFPHGGQDVPDEREARLVVLGIEYPYSRDKDNAAEVEAQKILEMRGNTPRLYRNTLVFLAPDRTRLQDLDEAVRRFLAWDSIVAEKDQLDLSRSQIVQAEQQRKSADSTVAARIPETYQWGLVPSQSDPRAPSTLSPVKVTGQESLAARVSRKLKNEELLLTQFAPSRLIMELDRVPLWQDTHVSVKSLVEDFARYIYLPRLQSPRVLISSIGDGISLITWEQDGFAWADSWDADAKRFRGLRFGERLTSIDPDSPGLIVKATIAADQIARESKPVRVAIAPDHAEVLPSATLKFEVNAFDVEGRKLQSSRATWAATGGTIDETGTFVAGDNLGQYKIDVEIDGLRATAAIVISETPPPPRPKTPDNHPEPPKLKRFHGTVVLDSDRVGRDAGRIAEEIISHLATQANASVRVTLEIEAEIPDGAGDGLVRTVTENARTLKFESQGFERE